MQGSIFTSFSEMIIDKMGMKQCYELLEKTEPASQGMYTSGEQYEDGEGNDLIMYYGSKCKLCYANIGLIYGAVKQFKEKITIIHPECMHAGKNRCKLIVKFKG